MRCRRVFGLDMGAVPSEFIEKLGAYAANITTINPVTVAIGAVALVILILWPKVTDKLPGSLIAIIVTTAIVYFAKLPVVFTENFPPNFRLSTCRHSAINWYRN